MATRNQKIVGAILLGIVVAVLGFFVSLAIGASYIGAIILVVYYVGVRQYFRKKPKETKREDSVPQGEAPN